MSTSTTLPLAPPAVRVVERSFAGELRAVRIVWQREMIRFFSDKMRIVVSLLQPMLYLFVLGTGLSPLAGGGGRNGAGLQTFLFPGVMAMSVLMTCIFSAGSMVWDREFGFLREMLVAPVHRGAIVVGKCLGGASAGALQGLVMLLVAGAVGVPYAPTLILTLTAELLLLSFAVTAMGVLVAARIKTMQSFMAMGQLLIMPMFFLSGALFPLFGLPGWLRLLTSLDPITYVVDPMRRAVFSYIDTAGMTHRFANPGVMWGDWPVPIAVELAVVVVFALVAIAGAIAQFGRTE